MHHFLTILLLLTHVTVTAAASTDTPPAVQPILVVATKSIPVLGLECAICEDVVDTFKGTFACPDADVGDSDSNVGDAEDDIHCTFQCTMLCTSDEASCIQRRTLCELGQKAIDTSTALYTHIWQVQTCNMDPVDACARLPPDLQLTLGFVPQCQEVDWNILTSLECKDNVNCEEAKHSAVDDACFTCMWLFKTTPMFAGICEPPGVQQCDSFRTMVAQTEPITKEKYVDNVPDPWSMPPWSTFSTLAEQSTSGGSALKGQQQVLLRRRRRLLLVESTTAAATTVRVATRTHLPPPPPPPPLFTKDDKRGIGALPLFPLETKLNPYPGNCMALWRQVEASPSAHIYSRRMEDSVKVCKCMCQCPYTTAEYLELEPACTSIVDPDVYPFVAKDVVGIACKDKKYSDQQTFEEEAEDAAENGTEEEKSTKVGKEG